MPKLSLLFARRYLFSKKSHSVINIISGVSAFSVAIPVMAMVVLLSVFNGFEGLVKSMYKSFDPDIMITATKGKVFEIDSVPLDKLRALVGVKEISLSLEENALFEYRGRQYFGIVRGVDSLYNSVLPIDSIAVDGQYRLWFGDMPEAFVGQGIASALGIRTNLYDPISIYTPRRGNISSLLPFNIYNKKPISPSGVFALDAEVDGQYIIVPLEFTQELLSYDGRASAISVKLQEGASQEEVQGAIITLLQDQFKVLTRYQQKESFYQIMVYEKWAIYFIILLVLVVASFSLIGSLVMLIIDKRKDMQTLITMGADITLIRRIFQHEGMLISLLGGALGMILGIAIALAQQQWGFIGIAADTFLIDAYPVDIRLTDLLWIALSFTAISYIISNLTVRAMIRKNEIRIN